MSWGVGLRHGSDPGLLWLWRRPAAVVPMRPLAWEPPYAVSGTIKRQKKKKKSSENECKCLAQCPVYSSGQSRKPIRIQDDSTGHDVFTPAALILLAGIAQHTSNASSQNYLWAGAVESV